MPVTAFDDVNLNLIPKNAQYIFAYLNGRYANFNQAHKLFPHAEILGITITAAQDGAVLDVEQGDATIRDIWTWLVRRKQLGAKGIVYISASQVDLMMATMKANGFVHGVDYYVWSAHYTGTPHVCGPHSCGEVKSITCDGTQWTSLYDRTSLDASTWASWPDLSRLVAKPAPAPSPAPAPAPKPAPAPTPAPVTKPVPPVIPTPTPVQVVTEAQAEQDLAQITEFVKEHG